MSLSRLRNLAAAMQSVLGGFGASHAALRSPPFAAVSLRSPLARGPLPRSSALHCLDSCPAQLTGMRATAATAQTSGISSALHMKPGNEPVPGPMSWQRTFTSSPAPLQRHQRTLQLPHLRALHRRHYGASSDDEGTSRGSRGSSGTSAGASARSNSGPDSSTLFAHPTLRKSVMICGACSASASHTDHPSEAPRRMPGLVKGASLVWEDPLDLQLQRRAHLVWDEGCPKKVFIVKKSGSARTSATLKEIATWLESKGIGILVERRVAKEFPEYEVFDPCRNEADFCITLGGDGTVLHLTSLFVADEPLPPVVAFAMGTLGFLTPYDIADFRGALERVLAANDSPVFCTLRTRKCCEVYLNGERRAVHHVLNECLVDRGASPAMVTLQLSADRHHITTVQSDGLIISTPSGSTAYSMSAGGPMVAPSVAGTLITPIAPHSLSFRPLVVPESSEIVVHLPASGRSHARASFDGRHTMRLPRGSAIRCTTSKCALPMVSLGYLDRDWFDGITHKLKWANNIRDTGPPPTDYAAAVDKLHAELEADDSCAMPDSADLADPVDSSGSASAGRN